MTINEQLRRLRPHIVDYEIVGIFICVNNWANTLEGKLYAECYEAENFDSFLKQYGELKIIDCCIFIGDFLGGFKIGFVVDFTDL